MPESSQHRPARSPLAVGEAEELADVLSLFASGSRLKLLWQMLDGEMTVDALARSADMTPSATSHQLRLLREARLVRVRRNGRQAFYSLNDHHIPDLLAALRHHREHVDESPNI